MKLVTAAEMRQIDRQAIEDFLIPGIILMEHAALAVFQVISEDFPTPDGACIICGRGNNGGDGWAIARLLAQTGWTVTVFHPGLEVPLPADAEKNREITLRLGIKEENWGKLLAEPERISRYSLVVDALLGTGFRGKAEGDYGKVIDLVNQAKKPVIAVDIPSGLEADTGQVNGPVIKAGKTVTFGLPKVGLLVYPGRIMAGEIIVASIGLPPTLLTKEELKHYTYLSTEVGSLLPTRKPDAHKGDCGRVLVIGGSPGLTGAPVLAGMAALRSGAGLCTLGLREGLVLNEKPMELMIRNWTQLKKQLKEGSLPREFDVVIVGPGLSRAPEGRELLWDLLKLETVPRVIDADALNLLAEEEEWWVGARGALVLTPHPGEMARLTGLSTPEVQKNRLELVREKTLHWQVVLALKGAGTVVGSPEGGLYINTSGNPGMATGGTGDLLTGIIGALLAQGLSVMDSACLGVYIHGAAGDLAAKEVGYTGLIAGDLLPKLPLVLNRKDLREEEDGSKVGGRRIIPTRSAQ